MTRRPGGIHVDNAWDGRRAAAEVAGHRVHAALRVSQFDKRLPLCAFPGRVDIHGLGDCVVPWWRNDVHPEPHAAIAASGANRCTGRKSLAFFSKQ